LTSVPGASRPATPLPASEPDNHPTDVPGVSAFVSQGSAGRRAERRARRRPRTSAIRARRAAAHREQARTAAARSLQLFGASDEAAERDDKPALPGTLPGGLVALHKAVSARLSDRHDHDAVRARLEGMRAAGALQDPHAPVSADTDPGPDGGPPRKPKNSVAASATETGSHLRKYPRENGAELESATPDLGEKYEQRNNKLQKRMRLLDQARMITHLHSLRKCGDAPLEGAVAVTQHADGSGGFAGLFRCGSVWACPECAPIVRADRARTMETYAEAWMEASHGLAMATMTSRHGKHAALGPQIERTAGAWRRMLQSRWWRRLRAQHGIVGATRALEMTHSWANSWHTHIHAVLWFEKPVSDDTAAAIEAALYERWEAECKHAGLGRPTKKHGVKVDPARRGKEGAADLAKYVVKLQEGGALGNELLRGDMKDGRSSSRTPFEILRRALGGSEADMQLWHEYEHATKGHRMLTWSGTIKERLAELVTVEELAGPDVVGEQDRSAKAVLAQITPAPWRQKVAAHPGRRGQLRIAVTVASTAALAANLDPEDAARAAVRELLESWGLVWGRDVYGPDVDPETGEIRGERVEAQDRPERRRPRWESADQLEANAAVLDIRPRDAVRPEQAKRRAGGLPIAREKTAPATTLPRRENPAPVCTGCGHKLAPELIDGGLHIGC
jgi:hypothetical protein